MSQTDMTSNELQAIQLETARLERDLKAVELRQNNWNYEHPQTSFGTLIRSPVVAVGVFTALATLAGALLTYFNAIQQRETDRSRLVIQTILEGIKTGDPDKAAMNLQFLVQSGLLQSSTATQVQKYLSNRLAGSGPAVPPAKKSN